jgi:hypothetical protein
LRRLPPLDEVFVSPPHERTMLHILGAPPIPLRVLVLMVHLLFPFVERNNNPTLVTPRQREKGEGEMNANLRRSLISCE